VVVLVGHEDEGADGVKGDPRGTVEAAGTRARTSEARHQLTLRRVDQDLVPITVGHQNLKQTKKQNQGLDTEQYPSFPPRDTTTQEGKDPYLFGECVGAETPGLFRRQLTIVTLLLQVKVEDGSCEGGVVSAHETVEGRAREVEGPVAHDTDVKPNLGRTDNDTDATKGWLRDKGEAGSTSRGSGEGDGEG
jgi:hypothetical protein